MKVTKREILFSAIILFVMIGIGFFIDEKISDSQNEKAELYTKAVQITDSTQFDYGMKTNIGNALVYGEFKAVDAVSIPELSDDFYYIERTKERYTMHTRTVTHINSDGSTYTTAEVYWTWDHVGSEEWKASEFEFMGNTFDTNKINVYSNRLYLNAENTNQKPRGNYIYENSNVRYYYNYVPITFDGTILIELKDGTIFNPVNSNNKITVEYEKTIDIVIENIQNSMKAYVIIFWIVWMIFTGALILGFVYLDNKWLETQ